MVICRVDGSTLLLPGTPSWVPLVGFGGEVDMRGRGTPDIPRFGALRRDNTRSPAEFSWMVDSTMLLLELCEGGRRLAKAWAAPSPWCCYAVASPILPACLSRIASHLFHCPCRRGLLGGFIDQPTQGYNGNVPSRWVRIVGVRGTGLGPACGLVVHRVPLGAGPACLGGLCAVFLIVRA